MIYNYLESIKSQKILILSIFIIFISLFLFDRINISIKGIFGIFIGLIICWYFLDRNITKKNNEKELIDKIIIELPILKQLENEEELILFYYKNKTLIDYDIINFDNSILNAINFIKVYDRINLNSDLEYYQFDILEKHKYLCLEYFRQIEYNIPNQNKIIIYLKENLNELDNLLNKYLNNTLKKLKNRQDINIYHKFNLNSKVKEFNKYDYII
jgi:hypothetical protein